MKIGILAPSIYMSPKRFGKMIFAPRDLAVNLADGLVGRGHQVFLFSSPDTKTKARLAAGEKKFIWEKLWQEKIKDAPEPKKTLATFYTGKREYERDLTFRAYQMAHQGKLDIIHSWHDDIAHYFDDLSPIPTIYTLHDPLPPRGSIERWRLQRFPHHKLISISNKQRRNSKLNWVKTIHHGLPVEKIAFQEKPKDYLSFVGRFVKEKGIETAARVAQKTKQKIRLAGRAFAKADEYYAKTLKPLFKKTKAREAGMLNKEQSLEFLRNSRLMLFPIQWEEPFGLVMIEAMAGGTPVVAFNRGSVPEVIKNGITGYIVKNESEMVKAVKKIYALPEAEYQKMRLECRRHVEQNFSLARMVSEYEKLYYDIINRHQ